MKKYKLLRHGHCYVTKNGDFAVALIGGNKRHGYTFIAGHTCRNFITGKIYMQSRIVPNDGHWKEIPPQEFAVVAYHHGEGRSVTFV
jgi:hypothetical protein